jgi:hypothetical protein
VSRYKLEVPDITANLTAYFREHPVGGVFHVLGANDPTDSLTVGIGRAAEARGDWWGHALALALLTMSRSQRCRAVRAAERAAWRTHADR